MAGTAKPDLVKIVGEILDGLFVIQDHQGFLAIFPLGLHSEPDQLFRLQDVVGVAFHPGRHPTEVDEELLQKSGAHICRPASRHPEGALLPAVDHGRPRAYTTSFPEYRHQGTYYGR